MEIEIGATGPHGRTAAILFDGKNPDELGFKVFRFEVTADVNEMMGLVVHCHPRALRGRFNMPVAQIVFDIGGKKYRLREQKEVIDEPSS